MSFDDPDPQRPDRKIKFPVSARNSPDPQKDFPVNFYREMRRKTAAAQRLISCTKDQIPYTPDLAIFPVKFPVCREIAWRRVRSLLRRQPGSPAFGQFATGASIGRKSRLFAIRFVSRLLSATLGVEMAESLRPCPRNSRFTEIFGGDLVRSRLPPDLVTEFQVTDDCLGFD